MVEIVTMLMGLWLFIVFSAFCLWILDMGSEYDNWQKRVTVDDLRELDSLFKSEK